MSELTSPSLSLNLNHIAARCEEEWEAFLIDMDITPVPDKQDLRGFFLNWVAVFIPEALPSSLQSAMCAWIEPQLDSSGTTSGFVRPPLIGSTLFALTHDTRWLRIQFDNFADGGSLVRSFIHRSLALVAPRISFDPELLHRLDFGMKHVYFYMDVPLALYAVSQGDSADKLANLNRWQKGFMNSAEKNAVEGYLKGDPVKNPLEYWMLKGMTYVAMRLACFQVTYGTNSGLPLGVSFSAVWDLVQAHPLFAPYIALARPPEISFERPTVPED